MKWVRAALLLAAMAAAPAHGGLECPWDCADGGDGVVGINDMIDLLAQWQTSGACDVDGGGVGITDFIDLLLHWGPCPECLGDAACDDGDPCTMDFCDENMVCQNTPIAPCCGNGIQETGEDCDGADDDACPGACQPDCTCAPPESCVPGAGECCAANTTPGCSDVSCCELICSLDPFCCDVVWDGVCADQANKLCDCGGGEADCGVPGTGDCCEATGSPYCDDLFCCDFVCALDPFCCDVEWDDQCAALAAQTCAICQ